MNAEMAYEEKEERIKTIINYLMVCPHDKERIILKWLNEFDTTTLLAFVAIIMPVTKNFVTKWLNEVNIQELYIRSKTYLCNAKSGGNHEDHIKYLNNLVKFYLSCPDEEERIVRDMVKNGSSSVLKILFEEFLSHCRDSANKIFEKEDIEKMYSINKQKMIAIYGDQPF